MSQHVRFSPQQLKTARHAAALSRTRLASAIDVSHDTVVQWEQGLRVPRSNLLAAAAGALGCAMEDLFAPVTDDEAPEGTSLPVSLNRSDGACDSPPTTPGKAHGAQ